MNRLLSIILVSFTTISAQEGSRFLEPHRPYSIGGYQQLVYEKLGLPRSRCSMVVFPSLFGSEYSISISEKHGVQNEATFTVEYAIANRLIWQTIPFATRNKSMRAYNAIKIHRRNVDLPPDISQKIFKVWEVATKNTRYDNPSHGLDGVTYDFAYERKYFGTAWCPDQGDPKLLADIGEELVKFVEAAPSDKGHHLVRINQILTTHQLTK